MPSMHSEYLKQSHDYHACPSASMAARSYTFPEPSASPGIWVVGILQQVSFLSGINGSSLLALPSPYFFFLKTKENRRKFKKKKKERKEGRGESLSAKLFSSGRFQSSRPSGMSFRIPNYEARASEWRFPPSSHKVVVAKHTKMHPPVGPYALTHTTLGATRSSCSSG